MVIEPKPVVITESGEPKLVVIETDARISFCASSLPLSRSARPPRRTANSIRNSFSGRPLVPGRYRAVLYATFDGEGRRGEQTEYSCGELEVTVAGGENVVLRPGERVQR